MRSATSFFDKTLFRSQLKHTWPLWLGYTALWLFLVPVALFSELSAYQGGYSAADASYLLLNTGVRGGIFISFFFGVNLNGARNTIQAVLPNMLHEKSGCIVNISSIWGQHGASCEVTYSCTKHALIGLTRSLAMELAPSGIRVNCVAPGVIETDMVKVLGEETLKDLAEQTPLGRLGKPEDIAAAVAYLASDKASFVTGQVLAVDGAFVL